MFSSLFKSNLKEITFENIKNSKKIEDELYQYKDRLFMVFKLENNKEFISFEHKKLESFLNSRLSHFLNISNVYFSIAETKEEDNIDYYLLVNLYKNVLKYHPDIKNLITNVLNQLSFSLVTQIKEDFLTKSTYYDLNTFDYSNFEEKLTALSIFKRSKNKKGLKLKNKFIGDFYFDEFNSDTQYNTLLSCSSNTDRINFLTKLYTADLESGKKLFLISRYNEFEKLKESFEHKIYDKDSIGLNFLALYQENNEQFNENIVKYFSSIIKTILNYDKDNIEYMLYDSKIENIVSNILSSKKDKGTLKDIYIFLKKEIKQEFLNNLEPLLNSENFKTKPNIELNHDLVILNNEYFEKYMDIGFFYSILLTKQLNNSIAQTVFGFPPIEEKENNLSYLHSVYYIMRVSRKWNISSILPVQVGKYSKKEKELLTYIAGICEHIFLFQTQIPKQINSNFLGLPENLIEKRSFIKGSKEIIYIQRGNILFLNY